MTVIWCVSVRTAEWGNSLSKPKGQPDTSRCVNRPDGALDVHVYRVPARNPAGDKGRRTMNSHLNPAQGAALTQAGFFDQRIGNRISQLVRGLSGCPGSIYSATHLISFASIELFLGNGRDPAHNLLQVVAGRSSRHQSDTQPRPLERLKIPSGGLSHESVGDDRGAPDAVLLHMHLNAGNVRPTGGLTHAARSSSVVMSATMVERR